MTVKRGPVGDLLVASGSEELALIGVVDDLLKYGLFEQTDDAVERANVPHDARTVTAGTHGLVIVLGDLD